MSKKRQIIGGAFLGLLAACGGGATTGSREVLNVAGSLSPGQVSPDYTFQALANHAYSVQLVTSSGDAELSVYNSPAAMAGATNLIGASKRPAPEDELVSFVASSNMTVYSSIANSSPTNYTSGTLIARDNHLLANVPAVTDTVSPGYNIFYYSFDAVAGNEYTITVTPTVGNPDLAVYSGMLGNGVDFGTKLAGSSNLGLTPDVVKFVAQATKTHYVAVDNLSPAQAMGYSIDVVEATPPPLPMPPLAYDFEDGVIPGEFSMGGDADWVIDPSAGSVGLKSIRAGAIGNTQTSCTSVAVANSTTITFDWMVSLQSEDESESDEDSHHSHRSDEESAADEDSESKVGELVFSVDGVPMQTIPGNTRWTTASFTGPAGAHTYRWCYVKNVSTLLGTEVVRVDNIIVN